MDADALALIIAEARAAGRAEVRAQVAQALFAFDNAHDTLVIQVLNTMDETPGSRAAYDKLGETRRLLREIVTAAVAPVATKP